MCITVIHGRINMGIRQGDERIALVSVHKVAIKLLSSCHQCAMHPLAKVNLWTLICCKS